MSKRKIAEFDGVSPRGETRVIKVYWRSDLEEYVCEVTDNGNRRSLRDYFTPDKQDALDTSALMCKPE